ncbi:MAG: hypothetical protein KGJ46_04220 [Xanthomonadaceae bacterium]|nr:hypothetical protein [Xanthomonadaceae bacterium]
MLTPRLRSGPACGGPNSFPKNLSLRFSRPARFFNAMELLIPPYATLSVLWDKQAKDKDTSKQVLLDRYESDYADTSNKMTRQLLKYARSSMSARETTRGRPASEAGRKM